MPVLSTTWLSHRCLFTASYSPQQCTVDKVSVTSTKWDQSLWWDIKSSSVLIYKGKVITKARASNSGLCLWSFFQVWRKICKGGQKRKPLLHFPYLGLKESITLPGNAWQLRHGCRRLSMEGECTESAFSWAIHSLIPLIWPMFIEWYLRAWGMKLRKYRWIKPDSLILKCTQVKMLLQS